MNRAVLTTHPQNPERIAVRFPYQPDVNERLKDHGGRWDPDGRTWHIPQASLAVVVAILRREFDMTVVDDTGLVQQEQPRDTASVIDRTQFYEAMFARLPEEDRKTKFRDLMRAFHPDAYGDPSEATAINVAYDRIRGRQRKGA